jgi:hypothetical protein
MFNADSYRARLLIVLFIAITALPPLASRAAAEDQQNLVEQSDAASASDKAFNEARSFIDSGDWREAEVRLSRFVEQNARSRHTPAALYYLALAFKKQNNLAEANRTINRLVKEFPRSSWAGDARKLRVEIASLTGNGGVIEEELSGNDIETKVIVLQGLLVGDPERAMQLVTEILAPESKSPEKLREAAVGLLGQHRSPQSQALLNTLARDEKAGKLRGTAIFWLGMSRDAASLELLKELARSDDSNVSQPAITSLATWRDPQSVAFLLELARTGSSVEARKQALFWVGQRADDQTLDAVFQIYDSEKSDEVKTQMIAGLGINRSKRALTKLIEIARNDSSKAMRSQAVFWIGQSRDPEAVKFLDEILK